MTDFYPWAQPYTDEETDRLVEAAPEHLAEEVRNLIAAVNSAHENAKRFATPTGRWFHVSPHNISVGSTLVPGGLEPDKPTSSDFYTRDGFGDDAGMLTDMGRPRTRFVWLTIDTDDAAFWAEVLDATYLYEVTPVNPRPWNGTGVDGWVCDSATVIAKLPNQEKDDDDE